MTPAPIGVGTPRRFTRASLWSVPNPRNVRNVVYTCGAIRHGVQITLPYAISDTFSDFATIKIATLMQAIAS